MFQLVWRQQICINWCRETRQRKKIKLYASYAPLYVELCLVCSSCSWLCFRCFFSSSFSFRFRFVWLCVCVVIALHIAVLAPNWSTFHIFNLYVIGHSMRLDSSRLNSSWGSFIVASAFVCAHTNYMQQLLLLPLLCCMPTLQTNRLTFLSVLASDYST